MSPSWVEGGSSGMPPAQQDTARHPARWQEQHQSPALSSSPAPGLEPPKQPWSGSGSGTGWGTASPSLAAEMTTVVLSLGRRRIFPWLKATLTNSPQSLPLAGWIRKKQRRSVIGCRIWAVGGSSTEGYASWATAANVALVPWTAGTERRTERRLQASEPLQQPRCLLATRRILGVSPGTQLMGSYSE